MRTVFLGTSAFAAAVLERLAASPHRPELVVTRPERPRGRGRRLAPPPVAQAARALDLPVDQPESVNDPDVRDRIAAARPDAVCVCAFGALVTEPLLSAHLMLNVHPSLLPRWRGAAPVERAIMSGDAQTGVCIMRLSADLDAGPVARRRAEPIHPEDTYGSLAQRLQEIGGAELVAALDAPPAWSKQGEEGITYAEKIGPEDRRLDPRRPAAELERRVRALTPHIGAVLPLADGTVLGVRAVGLEPCGPPAGTLSVAGEALWLGCASGALRLLEVQPAGRRAMPVADYLRGHEAPVAAVAEPARPARPLDAASLGS